MSFQSSSTTYLQKLAIELADARATGEATPELSFRGSLKDFLTTVMESITSTAAVIHEPKRRASGAPDFRVHDRDCLGVYGFIEAKGPDLVKTLASDFLAQHEDQIKRYRSMGYRIMVTDGLDFYLFHPNDPTPEFASLIDKPAALQSLSTIKINPELYTLFAQFLEKPTFRSLGELGLVELTAKHAREIARVVTELTPLKPTQAVDETERRTIERLNAVHDAVAEHLDPHLRSIPSFGGFVAQVLAFSLLYAHRVEFKQVRDPQELYRRLAAWGNPGVGSSEAQLRPFRELIRLLGDELEPGSSGDLGRIYDTLRTTLAYVVLPLRVSEAPEYHTLYETFLDFFDSNLRERYGAYYTPRYVADACVRISLKATHYRASKKDKVVEPCCGTGSFVDALQRNNVTTPITALEILPSAYALACFRQSLHRTAAPVHIVLTNTMSDAILESSATGPSQSSLFALERTEARLAIRPPVVLVIGNPPARDVSTSDPLFCSKIYDLLEDFRPPKRERGSRGNLQKQTSSTAMQFLRWSAERVLQNGAGAISLLLPASFVSKPSYRFARRWLRAKFKDIWVLEIDGDARAGLQANVFPVQQGRALVVATLHGHGQVRHTSITEMSKQQKQEFLEDSAGRILARFKLVPESVSNSSLRPTAASQVGWTSMLPLWGKADRQSIFDHQCSGIKLAPTAIFVNVRLAILKRRTQDLASFATDLPRYIEKWFRGQRKPPAESKFTPEVQRLLLAAAKEDENYKRYQLRPFLSSWGLISEKVLKQLARLPNSGTRYRPELLAAFSDTTNIGLGITPAPEDVSENLGRPAILLRHLPDNDLSRRGNIRVLAARSPGNKRSSVWGTLHSNVHPKIVEAFNEAALELQLRTEDAVVLYCYAVLSCQWFLDEWHDLLMECTGDEMPRIPLPTNPDLFLNVVRLGLCLDALESAKPDDIDDQTDFQEFLLDSFQADAMGNLLLFDEDKKVRWSVPELGEYLDFEAGGYNVVQEMLKWMTKSYMRAAMSLQEIATLYHLCNVLKKHNELQSDLEEAVRQAVRSEYIEL